MHGFIRYFAALLLLLLFGNLTVQAQDIPFNIGASYVAPEAQFYQSRVHVIWAVKSFYEDPTPTYPDSLRFTWLSRHRLRQARQLNLDLISVDVDTGNVVRDTSMLGNNVVEDICDAALTETLNVCIQDNYLARRFKGERHMFHPESLDDFENVGATLVSESIFDNFPILDMELSHSVLAKSTSPNAIRITPDMANVSGLTDRRMRELSVRRIDTANGTQRVSGLYYLSVILNRDSDPSHVNPDANDPTPVFNVEIVTHDAANTVLQYPVREAEFYVGGALREGPFELALGLIELRQNGTRIYIEPGGAIPEWGDTLVMNGEVKITQGDSLGIMTGDPASDSLDIRISYGSGDATCLLDAVCLTNPGTYGLFYPDSTRLLNMHRFHRSRMEQRIASILNDEGRRTQFENLRFIVGPEQIEREGTWRTGKLMQRRIQDASGGTVQMHLATSAATDTVTTGAMHAGFTSGFYYYPLLTEHPRPTLPATNTATYYESLHNHNHAGFAEEAISFRKHAEKRGAYGATTPWIPYIQNHSNLYETNRPGWWDNVPNREPSAAELRHQCNLALAHAANGVMFYSFASAPWETTEPFWPEDQNTWDTDLASGSRPLDLDMGTLGFLGEDDQLRVCDWNGENKCDSLSQYIWNFLKPIGTYMGNDLHWSGSKVWNWDGNELISGTNRYVSKVISQRQDLPNGIDRSYATYVVVSEFKGDDGHSYVFVLNARTHPEGQRHITVKPTPMFGDAEILVTEVHSASEDGDVWIVRPDKTPDRTTTANGFTDYFEAGEARLYRLEPIVNETTDFAFPDGSTCDEYNRSIYIEPAATLRLKNTDVVAFNTGKGIYSDGELIANESIFRPCDSELTWDGIFSRNGGEVTLSKCHVIGGRAAVGPASFLTLVEGTHFEAGCDTCSVLTALGGKIVSGGTVAEVHRSGKYVSVYHDGSVYLSADSCGVAPSANNSSWGINMSGGYTNLRECRLFNLGCGISARDLGLVTSGSMTAWGKNRIRAVSTGLLATSDATIEFGVDDYFAHHYTIGKWGKLNSINVEYPQWGYHAWNGNAILNIYADSSYWSTGSPPAWTPSPKTYGVVSTLDPLPVDPIPFTGANSVFSKTTASSPPPPVTRLKILLMRAAAALNAQHVRNEVSTFIRQFWSSADVSDMSDAARYCKEYGLEDLRDSIKVLLLSRQDLVSKLLFSDLAVEDSMFSEAAEALDSYSFAGSPELLSRALIRKAMVHPLTEQGGYVRGLAALDSLHSIVGNDPVYTDFIALYPKLFSGLQHRAEQVLPKRTSTRYFDRILPTSIDVWPNYPNPFADITSFTFKLGEATHVSLAVYDAMGREVAVVTDADFDRGVYSAVLHSGSLPNGLYFYRLTTGAGVIQRKMMLVR